MNTNFFLKKFQLHKFQLTHILKRERERETRGERKNENKVLKAKLRWVKRFVKYHNILELFEIHSIG